MADGRCRICGGEYSDPSDPNVVVEGLCRCCDAARREGQQAVATTTGDQSPIGDGNVVGAWSVEVFHTLALISVGIAIGRIWEMSHAG